MIVVRVRVIIDCPQLIVSAYKFTRNITQSIPTRLCLARSIDQAMPFFQGASNVNVSHGTFNEVTGDQIYTNNSNHSTTSNSNNTTTVDKSSKVTDSSVHHSMGKITITSIRFRDLKMLLARYDPTASP